MSPPSMEVPEGYEEFKKRALERKKFEKKTEHKTRRYIV